MITATTNFKNALAAFRHGRFIVAVEITGYSRVFTNFDDGVGGHYPWIVGGSLDDLQTTLNDLDGGADQSSWGFTVQDVGNTVTADFASFTFEGKAVSLKVGFEGLAYSDYCQLFAGYVDTVSSGNSNSEYHFSCSDIASKLAQVVYLTGDDGFPTSSDHLKTLNAHPLDIMLDILLTELGLSAGLVDSTKIEAYRDGPFAGQNFLFHLDQAPAAADFIKNQILKPLGGYMWVSGDGQITVNFFYPLAGPVAAETMGRDTWLSIPSAEQVDLINTVQFKFDKDDGSADGSGNYLSQDTETYAASIAKFHQYGELVIEADGLRSAEFGFFMAKIASRLIFFRYGNKNLKFDQDAAVSLVQALLLEAGDIVAVTHPQVPDRQAGTMGVTARLFEVLDKSVSLNEGTVLCTMIDASYLSTFGLFKIAPDGHADYAGSSSGDKAKYMFMCNDSDQYSNADDANVLG